MMNGRIHRLDSIMIEYNIRFLSRMEQITGYYLQE